MSQRHVVMRLAFLLCGIAFALRVSRLTAQSFWFDEGLTVDLAVAPPAYVFETIDRPPLYYALLHMWIGAAGAQAFTLRFFSVAWGTLAVALAYRLGRQLLGQRLGLWGMVLATFSPFYIYYAQEARTYALTLALALLSTCALLAWLARGQRRWLAVHALATLACWYTHYTALLLPLMQVGLLLTQPRRTGRVVAQWAGAQASAGVLFLPWPLSVRHVLLDLAVPGGVVPPLDPLQHAAHVTWTTLVEWSIGRTLAGWIAPASAICMLFLVILGARAPNAARPVQHGLTLAVALPVLALILLPRSSTYFSPKYLLLATPAFYLLTALGLDTLRQWAPRLWWTCLLVLALAWGAALADWFLYEHMKVAWQGVPWTVSALYVFAGGWFVEHRRLSV